MTTIPRCSIDVLVYIADERRKKPVTLQDILSEICVIFNQPLEKVKSADRHTEIRMCRYIYAYVAKKMTGHTFLTIAKVMGAPEHSRCMHNIETVESFFKTKDSLFAEYWDRYLSESKLYRV